MHSYKLLINAKDFDEVRVAIVNEDGILEQVDFESLSDDTHCLSNIYLATITAIEPSLQATFVDYGGHRHGFLPFNEIHPSYYQNGNKHSPVEERLKVGQNVLVQVVREEIGLKGAYLTTYISLAGRFLVMMPFSSKVGISRKIEDPADRASLRAVVEQITVPDSMGYIIRTAGLGRTPDQIQRDINVLVSTWKEIQSRSENATSPYLLYKEDNVVNRTIRDYFNEEINEILVDDREAFDEIKAYFNRMMPDAAEIVKLYRGKAPIFSKYQIENQVEKIFTPRIKLPSGGSIVIEQTEALVVIDVNSGKTAEGNLELTALKTNLEAAEEAARQLRLRDLGGLVVIDFIDLKERRNIHDVENALRENLKMDKARVTFTGISRFGLLEMSRQRIKTSKEIKHYEDCPVCHGQGKVKSLETQVLDLLRRIKITVSNNMVRKIVVACSEDLGIHLLNARRTELAELEARYEAEIVIHIQPGLHMVPRFEIIKGTPEVKDAMPMPTPLSLASMAASMSEEDLNERKDYREEKLAVVDKLNFEDFRKVDVPLPRGASPFEQFNFSIRVLMMKRHGLYENRLEEFKTAVRDQITGGDSSRDPVGTFSKQAGHRAPRETTGGRSAATHPSGTRNADVED